MNKHSSTLLRELPVQLHIDLYVEVVIAALIEQGKIDPRQLYIRPKSTFARNYRSDVTNIEVREDSSSQKASVFFDINREGLYDMLPEGLFHHNLRKTKAISAEESAQEIKMHREEEKHARAFFSPLEQVFYQQRIVLEIEEQKSLIGLSETIVDELITQFWNITVPLTHYQALCLAYMLPMLHRIVGDFSLTEQCLEILLQEPVSLRRKRSSPAYVALDDNRLGSFALGDDFLLNDWGISEAESLVIAIGPLINGVITDYLPTGKQQDYLSVLASYFIPAALDWSLEIIADPKQKTFELGSDSKKGTLNYTTII